MLKAELFLDNRKPVPEQLAANLTRHVITATHWRFHFAVAFGTLGNRHFGSRPSSNHVMLKFFAAMSTGHAADAHSTLFAGICCHGLSSY